MSKHTQLSTSEGNGQQRHARPCRRDTCSAAYSIKLSGDGNADLHAGDAIVSDLGMAIPAEHNVAGLQIPVHHAGVTVGQALYRILRQLHPTIHNQPAPSGLIDRS